MGRIEELAAKNLKAVPANPCAVWDAMVAEKMARDDCSRSVATDRLISRPEGSDAWLKCQAWDAEQRKILPDGTKSGNWLNRGNGVVRRVPRAP